MDFAQYGALFPNLNLIQILIGAALGFFLARQFPNVLPKLSLGSVLGGIGGSDAVVNKLDELLKKLDELKK